MKKDMLETIELPEGISASAKNRVLTVKGQKGKLVRNFSNPKIEVIVKDNSIQITSKAATKREKTLMLTFKSHIKNMVLGVTKGFEYELKICSGHFPMNVSYNNNVLAIKNFLGESIQRTVTIKPGVDVKVDGQTIIVEGIDKEKVGQAAADIEQLTRITNRDRRIFQDGIYITKKAK